MLEIRPSTYYAAKKRERESPARDKRDEWMKKEIERVWADKKTGRRTSIDAPRAGSAGLAAAVARRDAMDRSVQ